MEVGSSSLPGTTSDSILGGLAQLARAPALQAGGQRFESVILHDSRGQDRRSANEVSPKPDTRRAVVWEAIFDILTHKTVSKDFLSRTE